MQRLVHWILRESWVAALELAIVMALAVSLAYWTWEMFAPRPVAMPALSVVSAESGLPAALAARGLLGAREARAQAPGQAGSAGGLTLVGVFAARAPGAGSALIGRGADRPQLVATGDEIAPGVVLEEVHADHVTVRRGAALERIALERRGADGTQPQAGPPPARAGVGIRGK